VTTTNAVLDVIRRRRHMGALMLTAPGPDTGQLDAILEAALAAPDHGRLLPFRFVVVPEARRAAYVETSLAAFRAAVPDADEVGLKKARGKAEQPPTVIGMIAAVDAAHAKIVASDQWLTVGCALQNLWLAAESLGFGAGVSSGRLLDTAEMRSAFAVLPSEKLVAIISLGTPREPQAPRPKPALADILRPYAG
jgi:nitroreductase